ncbi:MAG: type II CRISPR RNA-guided endonuclease Cas9 [Chloroflexi bacterium]|nr:type II CRISPR RNA-guided endonuclease Cas9 [Chloroflexota bacterium]
MSNLKAKHYILGLDAGSNSLGWALIKSEAGKPQELIKTGVRVFDMGAEGSLESGKETSRNKNRRDARQTRKRLDRLARRLNKLLKISQQSGLLPEQEIKSNEERHQFFLDLDKELIDENIEKFSTPEKPKRVLYHLLPYILRKRALDEKLDPYEIGRALYHICQRRGFLSNRKAPLDEKEEGKVKTGISELQKKMEETGSRTLGEYFSKLDPEENRIRQRYTSRKMYEQEFEIIWSAQKQFYPDILTDELKKKIHNAIFYQRPLKSQKDKIGFCEFEEEKRRAPIALLLYQRFRCLQTLNNLTISTPEGFEIGLTPEQRQVIADALESNGDMSFAKLRQTLQLPKGHTFNLERGGEKKMAGNRTAAKLKKIFGDKWGNFSPEEQDQIVEDLRSIQKEETLIKRGEKTWELSSDKAKEFAHIRLEDGYCSLSRKALSKILPYLEKGIYYATAIKELYPDHGKTEVFDYLPSVDESLQELRNPVVHRSLTEIRKIVNSIIREYGKPDLIRVELGRDLKKSKDQRENTWKKNRRNEKEREKAAQKILEETGIEKPSRDDILKIMLAEECNWQCPYTGRENIPITALVGDNPQYDIEHIIPFKRCLDDSFVNKTLCYHEENRNVKRNKTPFEAYGNTDRWEEIIGRVKNFKGDMAWVKLERFSLQNLESLDDFSSRQLNDTRYASRLAAKYLGMLYGGVIDEKGKRRVQVSSGGVTAYVRNVWDMNSILGDGGTKTRDDHRHHAVDAVAVALIGPDTVKLLSDAAELAPQHRRRLLGRMETPWPEFHDDLKNSIENISVSRRVSRRARGSLHKDSFYSKPHKSKDGRDYRHIRVLLAKLTKNEIENIVDEVVKAKVIEKMKELGESDPAKAFSLPESHPFLESKDGRKIPIHSARIRKPVTTLEIGKGMNRRNVLTGSNHHVEIFEYTDKNGNVKWDGKMVSTIEAFNRLRSKKPVIKRVLGKGNHFLFSLAIGESVLMKDQDGQIQLFAVQKLSLNNKGIIQITFIPHNDARPKNFYRPGLTITPDILRKAEIKKVTVSPIGEIRWAND